MQKTDSNSSKNSNEVTLETLMKEMRAMRETLYMLLEITQTQGEMLNTYGRGLTNLIVDTARTTTQANIKTGESIMDRFTAGNKSVLDTLRANNAAIAEILLSESTTPEANPVDKEATFESGVFGTLKAHTEFSDVALRRFIANSDNSDLCAILESLGTNPSELYPLYHLVDGKPILT